MYRNKSRPTPRYIQKRRYSAIFMRPNRSPWRSARLSDPASIPPPDHFEPRRPRPPLGRGVKILIAFAILVFLFICSVPCFAFISLFFAQYR